MIKQYSENHPLNSATNKSRVSLSDSVSINQLLTAENKNNQNRTSTIRPSHERSTTSAEEENKLELSGSTVWPYPITDTELSEAVSLRGHTVHESITINEAKPNHKK